MNQQVEQNKIIEGRFVGLKDFFVAEVLENTMDTYSADEPIMLSRAINAKIAPKYNSTAVYSNNTTEYASSLFESGTITLSANDLSPEMKSILFGHKYNSETGLLDLSVDDVSNPVAIGFRATRSNGCKQQLRWYYVCVFSPSTESFATLSTKETVQDFQLTGQFVGRAKDGKYGVELDEEYISATADVGNLLTNWFSAVIDDSNVETYIGTGIAKPTEAFETSREAFRR
ncbi:major tail protein [uncultured Clostridium sp.]|uniref:major tail protein n=1 Tax=uncultured Clostridium sp. TaxID=59620 RepID=UPI00260DD4B7|nr:major tail protein [uncultured Clostridium sp.]